MSRNVTSSHVSPRLWAPLMSLRKTRSRRTSQRGQPSVNNNAHPGAGHADPDFLRRADDEGIASCIPLEQSRKEQDVWDALREEHYQGAWDWVLQYLRKKISPQCFAVIEQLPHSLHRAYALIGELDAQACGTFLALLVKEPNSASCRRYQSIARSPQGLYVRSCGHR